ncbi:hypothetical protein B9Q02_03730 [Candidatus Marsarchaeota G1 archaeon BE_D]|jgi:L-asparaginase|uniref:L-asparaginase n=1 Tax=Candidatus Marsarchaeota G1 archaeon BE_D TaxID=1978156 RepID=A0A2R6AIC9_9ARCH|nr:MAG: hypothetical protein B9Q02_03730 [Candidatus Marsarchaeota G1 archaeon BE_D]
MTRLPHITIISLGGTISSFHKKEQLGVAPSLSVDEIIQNVPQAHEYARLKTCQFKKIPSVDITFNDLVELTSLIEREFESNADGVVIIQGTDTMEETSFFFDITIDSLKPVVVTGAMKNPTLLGADGLANLLSAIQVAASKDAKGLGTLVVMNDEIHIARYVQKTHTTNLAAFRSPQVGPIGWIVENEVKIALRPPTHPHVKISKDLPDKKVALYKIVLGDDGSLLDAIEKLRFDGLVIEGTGGGHVPAIMANKVERLAKKIPVVLSSRTNNGQVLKRTYSHPGSEIDLIMKGVITSNSLTGLKARVLLYILLRANYDLNQIKIAFDEWF